MARDAVVPLGRVLGQPFVRPEHREDDVIDENLNLLWTAKEKRIITGTDLLGRLLRGIARNATPANFSVG